MENEYRLLLDNEAIIEGDEILYVNPINLESKWIRVDPKNHKLFGLKYRRKIEKTQI